MKYLFYAIVFDVAGNTTAVGSSASPAKEITTNTQKVTGITINPSSAQTKNIGENFKITATVSPSDADNKGITWNSSSTSVATVDGSGNVKCLAAGTTTITATAADGSGIKTSLELTVRDPLTSLTLDKPKTTLLYGGATTTVTAQTTPSDYDANNLTWTIGDPSLATISGTGKTRTITSNNSKKTGETTLTVSGGGKTATMKVSIVNFTTTTYSYTGKVQQVDLPAGTYKLEVWGAQGGSGYKQGGKGGYSVGNINLANNTILYIYIGQKGIELDNSEYKLGSGGGSSDIALLGADNSIDWNNSNHLYSRIIVAGGGGGAGSHGSDKTSQGGYGGGETGGDGTYNSASQGMQYGYGGLQTGGGKYHTGDEGDTPNCGAMAGEFGYGGSNKYPNYIISNINIHLNTYGAWNGGGGRSTSAESGGGGGGWYGGGAPGSNDYGGSGGGGSGYVYTSSTASNYPSGCLLNSSYYLTNAQTIAGNQSFPNVSGTGNETGHSGHGAAKITPVN